jgi:taurine dioxygenase
MLTDQETQETTKFTLKPLPAPLGAEVTGIDLSKPQNAATRKALHDAWVKHAVLVIRGQKLAPAQFAEAAAVFGELLEQQIKKYALPDAPLVGTISSRDLPLVDGKLHVRGENYHTDHSNFAAPPKATMLHAVSLPSRGGDTQFVDARTAFDDLPEETRRRILPLRSAHVYESSQSPRKMTALSPEERAKIPQTVQPLVIRHPDSGRAALYLNTARMEGIEGMAPAAAFKLIDELYAHATQPKYEYRHKWLPGDMVIWDNRSVMHQANADFDPAEYRFLYRIMLKGAPLQAAA